MPAPRIFGHKDIAESLWRLVGADRLPQTLLFAGPRGVGKSTLARHLAAGINCESGPGRPCGDCSSCQRIIACDLSKEEFASVVRDRRKLTAQQREKQPLVLGNHPDVLTFPPDGPSRMFSIHQARFLRDQAKTSPLEGRGKVLIIKHAERTNEHAASALLKTLEEPVSGVTIILTSENPYKLLPTIRSRSIPFHFATLPREEMDAFLQTRDDELEGQKEQLRAWSRGRPGVAIQIDVKAFLRRRKAMLALLRAALAQEGFGGLSAQLESIARNRDERLDRLSWMLGTLLRDMLRIGLDMKEDLTHADIADELARLAPLADFAWTERALSKLEALEQQQTLNINRQIALEAYALTMLRGRR